MLNRYELHLVEKRRRWNQFELTRLFDVRTGSSPILVEEFRDTSLAIQRMRELALEELADLYIADGSSSIWSEENSDKPLAVVSTAMSIEKIKHSNTAEAKLAWDRLTR